MVRFWSEPPLVREPDLALFGLSRMDPAEEQALQTSPLRRYLAEDVRRKTPAKTASEAIERIHGDTHEFVLHFDVDVIADFQATNLPSAGGLRLEEVREAFELFAAKKHLAAIEVTGYNPSRDTDGTGARLVIDFLTDLLAMRKQAIESATASTQPAMVSSAVGDGASPAENLVPAVAPGEAWSSDVLEAPEASNEPKQSEDLFVENPGEPEEPQP
jgi:hypothetical protein